jgi:signal transduction histidine kinase
MTLLPRRLADRMTVRMRLTCMYSALLLASGTLLLGVTYALVRHNISAGTAGSSKTVRSRSEEAAIQLCKNTFQATSPKLFPSKVPNVSPKFEAKCKAILEQAAGAGASAQRSTTLRHLVIYWLSALAVLTVLSALLGWWLAGRALRPVAAITTAARRAASGDLSGRLALTGPNDELRRLADTFDQMLERLQATFETQRQFIANASHELRTPLAVIRTAIDVTLAKPARGPAEIESMTSDIQRAAARSEALVESLLALARSEQTSPTREPVDLATLAEDALDETAGIIRSRQISVERDLQPAPIVGDPVLVGRMVGNLLSNAVRHNTDKGWVQVTTAVDQDGAACVTIENTGECIPPEVVPKLFEPFGRLRDRTARVGGVGLGLSIARAVAHSHGATLTAVARTDGGLRVQARFPSAG